MLTFQPGIEQQKKLQFQQQTLRQLPLMWPFGGGRWLRRNVDCPRCSLPWRLWRWQRLAWIANKTDAALNGNGITSGSSSSSSSSSWLCVCISAAATALPCAWTWHGRHSAMLIVAHARRLVAV